MAVFTAASVLLQDAQGRVLLIKENYGRYRYGLPGGAVEVGETPAQAACREAFEEVGVKVNLLHLIGSYRFTGAVDFIAHVFAADLVSGVPTLPNTGEIAEVGWFHPTDLPEPLTYAAPLGIQDALSGLRGVVRDITVP